MKFLSNYINDDIKTCNNCGLMMVWVLNQLFKVFYVCSFPINLRISLKFMNIQIR